MIGADIQQEEDKIQVHVQGDDVVVIYGSSKPSESLEPKSLESLELPESLEPQTLSPQISESIEKIDSHETRIPSEYSELNSESLEYLKSLEALLSSESLLESLESPELLDLESLKSSLVPVPEPVPQPVPSSYKAVVRPEPIKTYRAGSEESGNYCIFKMDIFKSYL